VGLGLDRATKVRDLAIRYVVPPALDHATDAELLEQRCGARGVLKVLLLVGSRYGHHESVYIFHGRAPRRRCEGHVRKTTCRPDELGIDRYVYINIIRKPCQNLYLSTQLWKFATPACA